MFQKKSTFKEKLKEFIEKIFSPISLIFKVVGLFSKKFFEYFKIHKEFVIAFTYGVGLFLQALFLFFSFGMEGLPYISITFSILFLVILLFLAFLGIPFVALFILLAILFVFVGLWPVMILFIFLLIFIKYLFPKFEISRFKHLEEKMDWLYIGYTLLLVILLFIGFIIQFTISKPVELKTEKSEIYGDLLFYNKDYYFLRSCEEKIIIPSDDVKEIRFICPGNKCGTGKLSIENKKYSDYCQLDKK